MKKLEASELRIGNYVRAKSPEISTFTEPVEVCITYLEMFCRPRQAVHFEPIPLTEDWLLKFGFTYDADNRWLTIIKTGELAFSLDDMRWCYEWGEWFPVKIEYVHQLQNLYYALTGEELILTHSPG